MGNKKQLKMEKAIKRIERMLDQQGRLIDIALSGGEATKPIMVRQSDVVKQGDMFVFADNFQRSQGIRDDSEIIATAHKVLQENNCIPPEADAIINGLHNAGLVLRWAEWTKTQGKDGSLPDQMEDKEWAIQKLAELDAAYLRAKQDMIQAGAVMLLARPARETAHVGNLKVSVQDWVGYDQDYSCMWGSCSDCHTEEYGCITVKKYGKRVALVESNVNWVTRVVNNYLIMKEASDKAAMDLKEFSSRNMGKDADGVKATYEGVPLTAEQAAQLDSGSGAEETSGWLAGDIADAAAEKGERMRQHRKRKAERKIKDEPQA